MNTGTLCLRRVPMLVKSVRNQSTLDAAQFEKTSKFIGRVLRKNFAKNLQKSRFQAISPLPRRPSTLVGLNHSLNNCEWPSTSYGALADSSLFSFDGVSAEILTKI